MYLSKFFNYFLLLVIVCSVFTSCTKDDPIVIDESKENTEFTDVSSTVKELMEMDNAESAFAKTCFDFVYPIELTLVDESKQAIESLEELITIFKRWYTENKDKNNKEPAFNYPIEVNLIDGTVKKIGSDKELIALIISCKNDFDEEDKDGRKDNCFEINYPVTVVYKDRSTLVVNNLEEYKATIEDNEKGKPAFVFPIEVTFDEDKILEVKSQGDLDKLYKDCKEKWYEEDKEDDIKTFDFTGGYSYCFQINYPVSIVMWDETVRTLANAEEASTWVNSEEFDKHTFQFPMEITLKDKEEKIITINTEEEWIRLRSSCHENKEKEDGYYWDEADKFSLLFSDCFEVNYPITIFPGDGNIQVVNSQEEVIELMRSTGREYFKFEFPIQLTINDEKKEIISMDDFVKFAVENCINIWEDDREEEDWENEDHHDIDDWAEDWEREIELLGIFSDCFQINYPLTLILADGTTQVVNNTNDMAEVVRSANRQAFTFQFPVNITVNEEEIKEIASLEELSEVTKACLENWQDDHEDWEDIWEDINWEEIDWEEDFKDLGFIEDCFKFNYPISVSFENRDDITVNNDDEFKRIIASAIHEFFNDYRLGSSEINFPLSVTLNNGLIETIHSQDELWKLIEDCE